MSDNPPRIALVGAGYWGKNLARNFAELGALAAIVEPNSRTAAEISANTGAATSSYDDVLADPRIRGVAVATPAVTHYAIAQRALAAGKHVYVEKPLTLDEAEADGLVETARQAGLHLMVGHLLRYHPAFRRLQEIVASGEIGDVGYIYSNRMSLGKIRTEENVLWSFAPHDISMILALAGDEPAQVTAQGAAVVNSAVADWATVQMQFTSGIRSHLNLSWLHYEKVQRLVVAGGRGTIAFEDSHPDWGRKLSLHAHTVDIAAGPPSVRRGETKFIALPQSEPLKLECRHFLDCIAGDKVPLTDGNEGRAVLRTLQRAETALQANLSATQADRD